MLVLHGDLAKRIASELDRIAAATEQDSLPTRWPAARVDAGSREREPD
jgi:hypothetical protein